MSIYLQLQVGIYYKPIFLFCVVMQKKRFILFVLNFNYSGSLDIQQTLYAPEVVQQIVIPFVSTSSPFCI